MFEFKYFQFFDSTVTSGEPLNYFFDIVDSPSGTSGPEEGDLLGLRLEQSSGDFAYYINAKLQVDDFSLARIELFPNPATNFLNINYSGGLDLSARIFTIDGWLIKKIQILQDQLDVSDLTNGVYFLEISNTEGKTVKRFVKQWSILLLHAYCF